MAWGSPTHGGGLCSRRDVFCSCCLWDAWCSPGGVFGALQASLVSVFPQEVPEGAVPGEWAVGRGALCARGVPAPTPCLRGHVQLQPGLRAGQPVCPQLRAAGTAGECLREAGIDHTLCFRASAKCRGTLPHCDPSPGPNTLVPPSTSPELLLLGPTHGTRCTTAWGCSPAPWGPCLESSGPQQAGSSWVKRLRKQK